MPDEIKLELVQKTQKSLGKYVKKPALSEKLLKKPPFRFLHDVISAVIKETGFLKGLYTEDELNSENVKEKDAKVAFLAKLIEAVKVITNTELTVKPSKVIAGLQPNETNLLLQTIAKAVDRKLDSSEYVKKLRSGEIIPTAEKKKPKKVTDKLQKPVINNKEDKPKIASKEKKQRTPSIETPKSIDRSKNKKVSPRESNKTKAKEINKPKTRKKKSVKVEKTNENEEIKKESVIIPTDEKVEEPSVIPIQPIESPKEEQSNSKQEIVENVTEERKRLTSANRPKSARPRSGSGDVEKSVSNFDSDTNPPPQPIELSSNNNSYSNNPPINRPKSSLLRPPSVRPSSARPGAPRLRPDSSLGLKEPIALGKINVIVESFDNDLNKDGDDEETVVIQTTNSDLDSEVGNTENILTGDGINNAIENKGHLVEQILEQINEKGDGVRNKVEIDWQQDSKESASKEANNLRSLIQSLTKTANPLGKLLNYLHEDIDAMHTELETWTKTKKQLFTEISKQKKIGAELNKPLLSQLENLNRDIKKVEEEVVTSRCNILRNDARIKDLLLK